MGDDLVLPGHDRDRVDGLARSGQPVDELAADRVEPTDLAVVAAGD